MKRIVAAFVILLAPAACSEADLIPAGSHLVLNSPTSMALIPGTSLAVVANANVNLTEQQGSLVAINLDTREVLPDTLLSIPSFAGRMQVDPGRSRIYVTDRGHDALLVLEYAVPASNGAAISFTGIEVAQSVPETEMGVPTDENPFDVYLAGNTSEGDLLLVTNSVSGSVSMIPVATLEPKDLDPDDAKLEGLRLESSSTFKQKNPEPGIGANRIIPHMDGRLLFVTSTGTNNLFVVDPVDQQIEAMLDLSAISAGTGTRGMVVASNGLAYIAHRGLDAILVLDVTNVREDGNSLEVLDAQLVDVIPTGDDPEGVALTTDELRLFVSIQGENSVTVINTTNHTVQTRTFLNGSVPGEIVPDPSRGVFYVLNFRSHSISVVDESNGDLLGTITAP